MAYLERNAHLIKELDSLKIERGQERGKGGNLIFYSLGSYNSTHMDEEVYVGLKQPLKSGERSEANLKDRVIFELAVMQVVSEVFPHWLPRLPLFHGLLVDGENKPLGILTEDFSRNGKSSVDSLMFPPPGIEDLFVEGTTEDDFLCNIGFSVQHEGERFPTHRYGDFYPLLTSSQGEAREKHKQKFPENEVEESLEMYTVRGNITE